MGLVGRKLSSVRLHSPAHARGLGSLGTTVTEDRKKQGDTTLTIADENGNVLLESGGFEVLLYAANIIEAELKPAK